MGALQRVIARVLARLRDINMSQRVALLLGGALVAVSLVWLAQWAASPEMVPLLPQDLQPDEVGLVRSGLEAMNEPCDVRGSRVYVRATANRLALIAQLQQQEKLPANTSVGFAALVRASDPWISQAENDRRWTCALQAEIQQVLRQFQGVRDARVFLNLNTQTRGFTRTPPASSASVTLIMKHGGEVPRPLALAAARLVSGAVAGLPAQNVQVVDANNGPALDWEGEKDPTNYVNAQRLKFEQQYTEKIRRQVSDPQALVSVQVELETTARNTQTETPTAGVAISEETQSEKTTMLRRSEDPGVRPNTQLSVGTAGADQTTEKDTSRTELKPGLTKKIETTPAGDVKLVTAAISLSASFLESVYRRANPNAQPPTDAQLEEVFQREKTRLLSQVVQLVKPQAETNVAISRYYDTALAPAPTSSTAGALDETVDLVRHYGPQSGLGLLALLALGLMLQMARKSGAAESFGLELGLPKEAIAAAQQAAVDMAAAARTSMPRPARHPGTPVAGPVSGETDGALEAEAVLPVGQAAVTEGVLVAQEVDAAAVQARKMLDQVAQMVDSDSEVISSLMEQWVQRNEQYRDGSA